MDKFLSLSKSSIDGAQAFRRRRWERGSIEVNGRFEPSYRHRMFDLLTRSYSEVGAFPHLYHIDGNGPDCQSHRNYQMPFGREGFSAVDFDNKGKYLASVTKLGCLTVHDFESLYCQIHESICLEEDETKLVLHLSLNPQLDAVRWNPLNQDEVFCASTHCSEVLIFDVSYLSPEPVEVLRTRSTTTVHGSSIHKGLSDVALMPNDSRVLASDTNGLINVWDRRVNSLPCLKLTSGCPRTINSIQLDAENQIIFGAGKHGIVHVWDIRGGRASATFQSHKEMNHPPVTSVKLASLLEKIEPLKAQSCIISNTEIHSINLNPSCPYQLAFHLHDGRSGVMDIYNLKVTHIHCPPTPARSYVQHSCFFFDVRRKLEYLTRESLHGYPHVLSMWLGLHLIVAFIYWIFIPAPARQAMWITRRT